ncbi:hypothetical protein [Ruania alba]|uniref:Uncharacterized protein n=1 Tax=Ruania alba TaxID=648782 RepID=A0A1H5N4F6_9MICO|nr:hypothetical protein [Ruania alba]SEE95538.1 hypothetical protein SAMN04488554_3854 [Ruania alba]
MAEPRTSLAARIAGVLGLVLFAPVLFLFTVSGLVAPLWAVVGMLLVGVATLAVAIWQVRRRPWLVLALPLALLLVWIVVLILGEQLLGWTA